MVAIGEDDARDGRAATIAVEILGARLDGIDDEGAVVVTHEEAVEVVAEALGVRRAT